MANVTPSMRHQPFQSGTFVGGYTLYVPMADAPLPATVVLNSSDATRKIQVSLDGTTYFTPVYDSVLPGQIAVSLLSGVASVGFTGVDGDAWVIL